MSGRNDQDDGFERLLRGETPGTPTERELGAFVEDVREAFPVQPLLAEDVHLARITEAAHLLVDKGDPVARPVSNAAGRAGYASGLPKRRGTIVRMPVWKSLAAKAVAGLVVLMSMFGGVAFAGALPGGLRDAVANVADSVVDLPGGEDEAEEPAEPVETETEAPDPVETETDDQGEDGDDQGEDESATETETDTESDDQGEDGDDQGEDGDDEGEDESATETETDTESDDQGDDSSTETENESESE